MALEQLVARPFEAAAIEELAAAIAAITGGALGETTARFVLGGVSEEDDVAGFLRVSRRPDGDGVLESLGRHPDFRGLGLGEHLVARGLNWLAELGAGDSWLEVAADNHAGLALYRSFGFRVSGEMNVYRRPV